MMQIDPQIKEDLIKISKFDMKTKISLLWMVPWLVSVIAFETFIAWATTKKDTK